MLFKKCRNEAGNPRKELHEAQVPSPINLRGQPGLRVPVRRLSPASRSPCGASLLRAHRAPPAWGCFSSRATKFLCPCHTHGSAPDTPSRAGRAGQLRTPSLPRSPPLRWFNAAFRTTASPVRWEGDWTVSLHRGSSDPHGGSAVRDRGTALPVRGGLGRTGGPSRGSDPSAIPPTAPGSQQHPLAGKSPSSRAGA